NGVTHCSGANQVLAGDVSDLGAHYGVTFQPGSSLECLDVGPTLDRTVDTRPTPARRPSFADLILYAINFSVVSAREGATRPVAAADNALALEVPSLPAVGQTFDAALRMRGAGDVQGLSATVAFDPAVLEQVAVGEGELLSRQGRGGVVLSSGPGDVD